MAAEKDEAIIKELITGFIREMNHWEKYCNELEENTSLNYEQQVLLQKEKLEDIFSRYCTKKERKNGRPDNISYGVSPSYEYDAKEEKIDNISRVDTNKFAVNTSRAKPMPEKFIYEVHNIQGEWSIDSKKRASAWENKWKVVSL